MRGELTAGALVGDTVRIWIENLVTVSLVGVVFSVPDLVFLALTQGLAERARDVGLVGVAMVTGALLTAALAPGVISSLGGRRIDGIASMRDGMQRALPAVGVGLLVGLVMVAGLFALIVPGVIIACVWAVAVPVAVVEPGRPALGRSAALTRGHRWMIFFVSGGTIGVQLALEAGLGSALEGLALTEAAGEVVLRALMTPVHSAWAIGTVVLYQRLREQGDGTSTTALAEVFE